MGYWGKIIGGVAGFAVGGPFGAVVGAALGHAADQGAVPSMGSLPQGLLNGLGGFGNGPLGPARIAALLGRREQLFAICVVVLAAKLAKCDGPVNRAEIDAFKRSFRIPPESVRDIGRLFDQARDSPDGFESYADAARPGLRRQPRRAGGRAGRAVRHRPRRRAGQPARDRVPAARASAASASTTRRWERANSGATPASAGRASEDPYAVLGVPRNAATRRSAPPGSS